MSVRALSTDDLALAGTDEPFYLEPGESVLWIRDNGDGSAVVRLRAADGVESVLDVNIRR